MNLSSKRILVTGADGFIGSHLVEHLVGLGADVRAFVYYNSFNSWGWLDRSPSAVKSAIDVFAGDIAVEGRLLKRAGVKLTSAAVKGWVKKSLRLDAAAGDVLQESRPTTVRLPSFKRVVGKRLNRKERKQTIQVKGVGKVAVDTVPVVLDAGLAERWGVDVYDWPVSDDLVTDGVRLTAVLKR